MVTNTCSLARKCGLRTQKDDVILTYAVTDPDVGPSYKGIFGFIVKKPSGHLIAMA